MSVPTDKRRTRWKGKTEKKSLFKIPPWHFYRETKQEKKRDKRWRCCSDINKLYDSKYGLNLEIFVSVCQCWCDEWQNKTYCSMQHETLPEYSLYHHWKSHMNQTVTYWSVNTCKNICNIYIVVRTVRSDNRQGQRGKKLLWIEASG